MKTIKNILKYFIRKFLFILFSMRTWSFYEYCKKSFHFKQLKTKLGYLGDNTNIHKDVIFEGHLKNIHIGNGAVIQNGVKIVCESRDSHVVIGNYTTLLSGSIINTGPAGRVNLGNYCSLQHYSILYGHGGLEIGDYVRIAAHVVIIPANHIFTNLSIPITKQGLTKQGIKIGNDVWIGTGAKILDGVSIDSGSVIAAGCVVNKNIPEYSIVVGIPCRIVKNRKDDFNNSKNKTSVLAE